MEKLKQRWGVDSNFQIILILIVFSVTGSAAVFLAKPILNSIGLVRESFSENWWGGIIYVTLRILVIFPIYQVLLVVFGWLFGQFKFFWNFEKKMIHRLGLGFLLK
ncbi:DUF6787 family protein [Maribacter sp.]|uniref:DUF6787 family protein n=1 Tax=Maribacter sp. TaxID=1897614 RepID=UPI0025B93CBC|nr:DUF6787 family protein [Maribacter sp.]